MRCTMSPRKHRAAKPHGPHSHGAGKRDFTHGMRGHKWTGHGQDRICGNCGVKPRHLR
jgi:hypothetical protein